MAKSIFRIATRSSPLALWQTEYVKKQLLLYHPTLHIEFLPLVTQGDKFLGPLNKTGGKGLFVKELEEALLSGQADIAVHSMKDVPIELPPELELAVICQRGDPRDAFVSPHYHHFMELPHGARVGTSSLRRQCQLAALRPDLAISSLRGNVNTRLAKLAQGEFDAIILAAAGLQRLNMEHHIQHYFTVEEMLPSAGQGALGIECKKNDLATLALIKPLSDNNTTIAVTNERIINRILGGNCQVPIGAHAHFVNEHNITINGIVGCPQTKRLLKSQQTGAISDASMLAKQVAEDLLAQGADKIMQNLMK